MLPFSDREKREKIEHRFGGEGCRQRYDDLESPCMVVQGVYCPRIAGQREGVETGI